VCDCLESVNGFQSIRRDVFWSVTVTGVLVRYYINYTVEDEGGVVPNVRKKPFAFFCHEFQKKGTV
jgi:hypothetical protein